MTRADFFKHFELLAAQPDAVAKMRELILELAVRGKLVGHNPKDETVSELLKKIENEKKKFLGANGLKPSEIPATNGDALPFDCPQSWKWTRLGTISNRIHYGYTASADHFQKAVRLLRITDIQDNQVNWETVPGCQISESDTEKYALNENDILIARTGGTIGKTFLVENVTVKAVFASYLIRVIPSSQISARYLKLFLESPCYWQQLTAKSAGTGQPNVNGEALSGLFISLPPLAEQRRIVAKVDELMALCDELEKQQQQQQEARERLTHSAFHHLTAAKDQKDFQKHFSFILQNSSFILDDVSQLRQTILALAVQGCLVPQNPKDEPAEKLIADVRLAKAQLVKKLELKELNAELPICDEDKTFELPRGWAWAKLADLCIKLGAGSTPLGGKQIYEKSGVKFLRSQNVWDDGLHLDDVAFIPRAIHKDMSGTWVQPGDVLLNITGASIGRSAVVPDDFDEANVSQHVSIVRLADKTIRHFLHLIIISQDFQERIMNVQVGVSREGLSMTRLKEFVVAVPPLAEQKRIVARVEELMRLCDQLEAQLNQFRALGVQLLDSAIHHLLAA